MTFPLGTQTSSRFTPHIHLFSLDQFLGQVDQGTLFELILAANYLDIKVSSCGCVLAYLQMTFLIMMYIVQGVFFFTGTSPKSTWYNIKLEYQDWYPPKTISS